MIYTVTFNPSLDYVVRVSNFAPGKLHRTQSENIFAGGKGINVSAVLKELGTDSRALGFVAGFTGREIAGRVNEMGIAADFIAVSRGLSRINIKLKTDGNMETEINGQGPVIEQGELEQLYEKLQKLTPGDFLVLSGNVPTGIPSPKHIYEHICREARKKGVLTVVDAEGELLRNTLCEQPFLIKPNQQELEMLFGRTMTDMDQICTGAKKLQEEGARNVLVTLAGKGAILLDEHGVYHKQAAVKGKVQNSVGAGDSLIAGFLSRLCVRCSQTGGSTVQNGDSTLQFNHGAFQSEDYQDALRSAVAAGSAGAFSIGLPTKAAIDAVLQQMLPIGNEAYPWEADEF